MRERFRLADVVWVVTTLFILVSTAAPFHFDTSLQSLSAHVSRIRLNPLISPDTGRRISIPDFVQNLLLFVPFGAAAVWAFGDGRPFRRIVSAGLLGCAVSVGAESIQLLTTDRISSFADVLANTAGAVAGAVIAVISRQQLARLVTLTKTGVSAAPTYRAVVAIALLVCIASWQPFDVTLDVGVVAGHLKAFRAGLWHVSFSADDVVVFVLSLLFGFMLTQWLRELHVRFPVVVGIGTVITAGIALEAGKMFVESRLPTVAGALASAGGGLAGAVGSALWSAARTLMSRGTDH
jgi:glycopeptide antibiotics resistance protein